MKRTSKWGDGLAQRIIHHPVVKGGALTKCRPGF